MKAQEPHIQPSNLSDLLTGEIRVAEPDSIGSLTVFPLFGGEPRFEYTSFADGRAHGATITELEQGASVRDLVVNNPTPMPLLLFDGEEILGAQQNRTLDVTVMVAAGQKTSIPVSCVEQGRWDSSRHRESFDRAPQAAYPDLRRTKSRQAREMLDRGLEARADQGAVWAKVAEKASRMHVHSPTGAMHDVYEARRDRLVEASSAVRLREGQVGMLAFVGGKVAVLDYVSRSAVFAELHGPLVQGYALDALEHDGSKVSAGAGEAEGFLELALENRPAFHPSVALGQDVRFAGNGSEGSGLAIDGELVQLTAFPSDGHQGSAGIPRRVARVRRPSERR
jgi:hypothetical protein